MIALNRRDNEEQKMRYAELAVPQSIEHFVNCVWTLDCNGDAEDWFSHAATPDGCVELIHRSRGRSWWRGEQPAIFAAGLSEKAAALQLSGNSSFVGIRLWPWAWNALCDFPASRFVDGWVAVSPASAAAAILEANDVRNALESALGNNELPQIARATLRANSVSETVHLAGTSHRQVQRWFARNVGIAPRRYLRVVRFGQALARLEYGNGKLVNHAADAWYSDQAHMARDFRRITGLSTTKARDHAIGPFVNIEAAIHPPN